MVRLILDGVAGGMFLFQGKYQHIKSIVRAHWSFYRLIPELHRKRIWSQHLIRSFRRSEKPNLSGRYGGSVVWKFYIRGKKQFNQLWK